MRNKTLITEIIRALFIILFIYAAANKLMDLEKFQVQIGQSPLLTSIAEYIAWGIPLLEVGIVVMLCIPKLTLKGLYLSFGLMLAFTGYIIAIMNFSYHIPCSCGGILDKMSWSQHLVFNIFFVILGLVAIILYPMKESQTPETVLQ